MFFVIVPLLTDKYNKDKRNETNFGGVFENCLSKSKYLFVFVKKLIEGLPNFKCLHASIWINP